MPRRIPLRDIGKLHNENIFLDTNIWIFLFCPVSKTREFIFQKYSKAFKGLIKSNNRLFTDFTILSEFINRYTKLSFQTYLTNNKIEGDFQFKRDYKETEDFQSTTKTIISTLKNKILRQSTLAHLNYDNDLIVDLLDTLEQKKIDFNDLHIEKLCRENQFTLLTDDRDYISSPIDIVSGNPKLVPQ